MPHIRILGIDVTNMCNLKDTAKTTYRRVGKNSSDNDSFRRSPSRGAISRKYSHRRELERPHRRSCALSLSQGRLLKDFWKLLLKKAYTNTRERTPEFAASVLFFGDLPRFFLYVGIPYISKYMTSYTSSF